MAPFDSLIVSGNLPVLKKYFPVPNFRKFPEKASMSAEVFDLADLKSSPKSKKFPVFSL
jgi:hypothetical protein